jgi:Asp-tRNA(Asn)/Glu-tRNA(Gln) amidotransferase A subunit family amidase
VRTKELSAERSTDQKPSGTDTMNSLRSPASANNLFSFRPTRGLISRAGIIPVSHTQDAAGAFARTVDDLAIALTVMSSVGYDSNDNTTSLIPTDSIGVDYSTQLADRNLRGLRFGLLEGFFNRTESSETTPVNNVMSDIVAVLQSAGAVVVSINETVYRSSLSANDVQSFEYRQNVDSYLQMPTSSGSRRSSLNELYAGDMFLVLPRQYEFVKTALRSSTSNVTYPIAKLGIQNLTTTLRTTFLKNNLDAIIYPEQQNLVVKIGSYSQIGRNGILAALTGFPVVTVPAGFSPETEDAPIGVPIGMEILGLPWSESQLLNIASHISKLKPVRRMPSFANQSLQAVAYDTVPNIIPNTGNIPSLYPIGIL